MSLRLELEVERELYTPGDTVPGTVLVLEGGPSRTLRALLEYIEETEDYSEVAASISSNPLHAGDLTAGMAFEVELFTPYGRLPEPPVRAREPLLAARREVGRARARHP